MAPKVGDSAREPGTGGGANALTQDVFLACVAESAKIEKAGDEYRAARKAFRKAAKAKGVELGRMDLVVKMAEWERQEVRDYFDQTTQYAMWMGLPPGSQGELFASMDDAERTAFEWHGAGLTARRAGKDSIPPKECKERWVPFFDEGYKLKPFVWDREGVAAEKAAAPPKAAAGKGRSAARASKVAGAITPPPATHTKETPAASGNVVAIGAKKDAAAGDGMPSSDGFGETGFGEDPPANVH